MTKSQLLSEVNQLLVYDPLTGLFQWKVSRRSRGGGVWPGKFAGTNKDGYVQIIFTDSRGKRHQFRAHRLAWFLQTGKFPRKPFEIDHINGDRSDNRWENLRQVTRSQNNHNANNRLQPSNKSGHRGVSWREDTEKWHARIQINKQTILLGDYVRKEDAIAARQRAEHNREEPCNG